MSDSNSFLYIDEADQHNKEKLLLMRRVLFAAVARNAKQEERKGMYLVALAIFSEFERLTSHILESEINKN
jgi:hypothetical protein